jgi:transcriptional regulator with PAS, ATPase and Fis domain
MVPNSFTEVDQLATQTKEANSLTAFSHPPRFHGLVGASPRIAAVYELVHKASEHFFPVLLLGETGTGKELVARSIHFSGPRRQGPFVPVDCSALVPTLIESELFGVVKGAFTGAERTKLGLIEEADGGTLFLDEIGNLSVELQGKLLRVLQEAEVRAVGSTERRSINFRIIAATNLDLQVAMKCSGFRSDLYYRLNTFQIVLPPLRDRRGDIPLLVKHFLDKFQGSDGGPHLVSEDVIRELMAYDWPGNVRELENAIERACALSDGLTLETDDFGIFRKSVSPEENASAVQHLNIKRMRTQAMETALRETNGDKLMAARILGIGKTTLYRWLKQPV